MDRIKLCSACLLGFECRYNGKSYDSKANPELLKDYDDGKVIAVCPEQLGGLHTPRDPCEIVSGCGEKVLDGLSKVVSSEGTDVTDNFLDGARNALHLARFLGADTYVAIEKSPSCGLGRIYDGTFSNTLKEGDGVTVALLKRNGVDVILAENYK